MSDSKDEREYQSGRSDYQGDYSETHPDETEEEFWDHEDFDD